MVPMRTRRGVVAVMMVTFCLPLTGCINAGGGAILSRPGGYPGGPSGNAALASHQQGYPGQPGQLPTISASDLQTTSYVKPQARFIKQASAVQGQPGDGDAPVLGMPTPVDMMMPANPPLPTELQKTTHAPHRVAAPDILIIEANRLVPKGPYKLEAMEVLQIEVTGAFKDAIKGLYMISPEGTINLGHTLLPIPVAGLTVDRAQVAISEYIRRVVKADFSVSVALVQMRGQQAVRGEHLVRPDGTISLGMYGSVFVAGMTLGQVKCTIENHLSAYLVSPQVSVDVFAYNSRKIYIIADGAGYGQQVIALPATGNETVLDAIARVQGLPPVASLKKIWVARPSPAGHPCSTVLPVNWKAITQAGDTTTNYQLLPGDRIYIAGDCWVTAYNYLDKMLAPIERVLGVTLLGSSTYRSLIGQNTGGLILAP